MPDFEQETPPVEVDGERKPVEALPLPMPLASSRRDIPYGFPSNDVERYNRVMSTAAEAGDPGVAAAGIMQTPGGVNPEQAFDLALTATTGVKPEVAAQVRQMSDGLDINRELIEKDPDTAKELFQAVQLRKRITAKKEDGTYQFPLAMRFLSDPDRLAESKDLVHEIEAFETLYASKYAPWYLRYPATFTEGGRDVYRNLAKATKGVMELTGEARKAVRKNPAQWTTSDLSAVAMSSMLYNVATPFVLYEPEAVHEYKTELATSIADSETLRYRPAFVSDSGLDQFLMDATRATPQLMTSVAANAAGGFPLSMALMSAQQFGGQYDEYKSRHGTVGAFGIGSAEAAAVGAVEALGAENVLNLIKFKGTKKALAWAAMKALGGGYAEESSQSIIQSMFDQTSLAIRDDMTLDEAFEEYRKKFPETLSQANYEGLIGAFHAGLGGMGKSVQMVQQIRMNRDLQRAYTDVSQQVQAMELAKRNPATVADLIQMTAEQEGSNVPSNFFVDPEAFGNALGQDPRKIKETLDTLGMEESEYQSALATGQDLEVPFAKFHANYAGSDLDASLRTEVKAERGGWSVSEAQRKVDQIQEEIVESDAEYRTLLNESKLHPSLKAMRETLMSEEYLGKLGKKAEDADAMISVWHHFGRQMSKHTNLSYDQVIDRLNTRLSTGDTVIVGDRRINDEMRDLFKTMDDKERFRAVFYSSASGLPGRYAFEKSAKTDFIAAIDLDGLKTINDSLGHKAGDALLKYVGDAFRATGRDNAYHKSGDEFFIKSNNQQTMVETFEEVRQYLAENPFSYTMPDGRVISGTVGASVGYDTDPGRADAKMFRDKVQRQARGERADRGEPIPGFTVTHPDGTTAEYDWSDNIGELEREANGGEELYQDGIQGGLSPDYVTPLSRMLPRTLRVFDANELQGKEGGLVNKETIRQVLKQKGVKKIEKEIFNTVLESPVFADMDKVPFDDFRLAVEAELMPLNVIETSQWANYGIEGTGVRADETVSVVYNSPLDHGFADHFSQEFRDPQAGGRIEWEIVEVPSRPGMYSAMVADRPSVLTEDNIAQYVGTVGTKAKVEEWVQRYYDMREVAPNVGVFGHVREWYSGDDVYLAENQSDPYQKNKPEDLVNAELLKSPQNQEQLVLAERLKQLDRAIGETPKEVRDAYQKGLNTLAEIKEETEKLKAVEEAIEERKRLGKKEAEAWGRYDGSVLREIFEAREREVRAGVAHHEHHSAETLAELTAATDAIQDLKKQHPDAVAFTGTRYGANFVNDVRYESFEDWKDKASVVSTGVEQSEARAREIREGISELKQILENIPDIVGREEYTALFNLFKERRNVLYKELPKTYSLIQKQFVAHKKNYTERLLRESIQRAAQKGMKRVLIPSEHTLAVIEGYVENEGAAPYEIVEARDNEYLDTGDIIEYGGEQMVVLEGGGGVFIAMRETDVNTYTLYDLIYDETSSLTEDAVYELPDEFEIGGEEYEGYVKYDENGRMVGQSSSPKDGYKKMTVDDDFEFDLEEYYGSMLTGDQIAEMLSDYATENDLTFGDTIRKEDIEDKIREKIEEELNDRSLDEWENWLRDIYPVVHIDQGSVVYTAESDTSESFPQPGEIESVANPEDFDPEDLPEEQQTVIKKYTELIETFKKMRGDVEMETDESGLEWFATGVTEDDAVDPVVLYQSEQKQTDTEAFKNWFGESKVTDSAGDPLVVYHGSPDVRGIFKEGFKPSTRGEVYFATDSMDTANTYADDTRAFDYQNAEPQVVPLYLSIKNPKVIDAGGQHWSKTKDVVDTAKKEGYDGVIIQNSKDDYNNETNTAPATVYAFFDPTQAKSAADRTLRSRVDGMPILYADPNSGAFDPSDPRIAFQEQARGMTVFNDMQTLVKLGKTADLSTFLHESAHVFHNFIENAVKDGIADAELTQDLEEINRFLAEETDPRSKKEKLARAFEAYTREGKAPTPALARAFAKFKKWLTDLYASIKNLNVELNDDIRGVFDRWLAADEEIEQARSYYGNHLAALNLFNIDEEIRAQVREKYEQAAERAKAKKAKQKEEAQGEVNDDDLRKQAEAEVDASPIQKVKAILKDRRMDSDELREVVPGEVVSDLSRRRMAEKGGTLTLNELRLLTDFDNVQEMINEIIAAPSRDVAVEMKLSELREQVAEGVESKQDGEIPGDDAYHSDETGDAIMAELEAMEQANARTPAPSVRQRSMKRQAYRDAARQHLAGIMLSDAIRLNAFAQREAKYAELAYDAAKKGDFLSAQKNKEMQLVFHFVAMEANRTRKQHQQDMKRIKKTLSAKAGSILGDYRDALVTILNRYGLTEQKVRNPEKFDFEGLIRSIDQEVPLPGIVRQTAQRDYRKMTVEEFSDLMLAARIIETRGRNVVKVFNEQKAQTVEDAALRCAKPLMAQKGKPSTPKQTIPGKAIGLARRLFADVARLKFDFKQADNAGKGKVGPNEEMFNLIDDQHEQYLLANDKFQKTYMEKIAKRMNATAERLTKQFGGRKFQLPGIRLPEIMLQNGYEGWTPEMLIAVALNTGNQGNNDSLIYGLGLSQPEIDKILGLFSSEELEMFNQSWAAIDTLFSDMDDTFYRINGYRLRKVEPTPYEVVSADGKVVAMRGGYYPLAFDETLSRKVEGFNEADLLKNESGGIFHRNKPRDGFTKERVGGKYPPKLDLQVLYRHISDTLRFTHLAEALTDVHKVVKSDLFANSYIEVMGKERYDIITPLLSHIGRPSARGFDDTVSWFGKAQRFTAASAFAGNVAAALKQPLSLTSAANEIGWRHIAAGSVKMMLHPVQTYQFIHEQSVRMRNRASNIDIEIGKQLKRVNLFSRAWNIGGVEIDLKTLQDLAFAGVRMGDFLGAYPAWMGAYNKATAEGQTHKQAVTFADRLVNDTQPNTNELYRTLWQIGGKEGHQATRALKWIVMPFTGWTVLFGNRTSQYWHGWDYGRGPISTADFAKHVAYERVAPALLATMMTGYLRDEDPKDWEDYLIDVLGYQVSWIPFVNQIPAIHKYGTRNLWKLPLAQPFEKGARAAKETQKVWEGEGSYFDTILAYGELTEFFTGVPAIQAARRIYRLIGENDDGSE